MDIYLPIAGMSVNAFVIILLGGAVGMLSGMFGVGGGFLTTPLLIFYGIPPTVAAASASTQVTGASVSGVFAHLRRDGVDFRMGSVLVVGGLFGTLFGAGMFELLQQWGQIDTVINILYVLMLGGIGSLMAWESLTAVGATRRGEQLPARKRRHHPLVASLPGRWRFYKSGLYISPLAPLILGFVTGILTMLLGVGGGFIMVPAMIYLLRVPTNVVIGTSLFQIIFVTAYTTIIQATANQTVDIVLAVLLMVGGVIGAQYGASAGQRLRGEQLRALLALLVLSVGLRLAFSLFATPDSLFIINNLDGNA
jgi:uncharacterized protein